MKVSDTTGLPFVDLIVSDASLLGEAISITTGTVSDVFGFSSDSADPKYGKITNFVLKKRTSNTLPGFAEPIPDFTVDEEAALSYYLP